MRQCTTTGRSAVFWKQRGSRHLRLCTGGNDFWRSLEKITCGIVKVKGRNQVESKERHEIKLKNERRRSRTAYLGTREDQRVREAREARARLLRPGFAGKKLEGRVKDC